MLSVVRLHELLPSLLTLAAGLSTAALARTWSRRRSPPPPPPAATQTTKTKEPLGLPRAANSPLPFTANPSLLKYLGLWDLAIASRASASLRRACDAQAALRLRGSGHRRALLESEDDGVGPRAAAEPRPPPARSAIDRLWAKRCLIDGRIERAAADPSRRARRGGGGVVGSIALRRRCAHTGVFGLLLHDGHVYVAAGRGGVLVFRSATGEQVATLRPRFGRYPSSSPREVAAMFHARCLAIVRGARNDDGDATCSPAGGNAGVPAAVVRLFCGGDECAPHCWRVVREETKTPERARGSWRDVVFAGSSPFAASAGSGPSATTTPTAAWREDVAQTVALQARALFSRARPMGGVMVRPGIRYRGGVTMCDRALQAPFYRAAADRNAASPPTERDRCGAYYMASHPERTELVVGLEREILLVG